MQQKVIIGIIAIILINISLFIEVIEMGLGLDDIVSYVIILINLLSISILYYVIFVIVLKVEEEK